MPYVVYKIQNLVTKKSYIGVTKDLPKRLAAHRSYGTDPVQGPHETRVLARTFSKKQAGQLEKFYIEKLRTLSPDGYNLRGGGLSGYKHSASTLKKIGSKAAGHTRWLGRTHSEKSRLKMSIAKQGLVPWNKGVPCSEATKLKISVAKKR